MMRGPELAGAKIARVERRDLADGTVEITLHNAGPGDTPIDLEATREELLALGDAGATICIRQRKAPVQEIVFAADTVPGFGWRSYRIEDGRGARDRASAPKAGRSPTSTCRSTSTPTTAHWPSTVDGVRVGRRQPLRRRRRRRRHLQLLAARRGHRRRPARRRWRWRCSSPARYARGCSCARPTNGPRARSATNGRAPARSTDTVATEVRTTLELRTGERFLRVRVDFDNRVRDHRLRAHFPLPAPVDGSDAECAFAVVRRGLTAEGGPHEFGLPDVRLATVRRRERRRPRPRARCTTACSSTRWSTTGASSRSRSCARPATSRARSWRCAPTPPARSTRSRGPQLQGPSPLEYAVVLHRGDWQRAALHDVADEVLVPLGRVRGGGWAGAHRTATGSRLTVEGARVSAVTRAAAGDPLTVRVFNPSPMHPSRGASRSAKIRARRRRRPAGSGRRAVRGSGRAAARGRS